MVSGEIADGQNPREVLENMTTIATAEPETCGAVGPGDDETCAFAPWHEGLHSWATAEIDEAEAEAPEATEGPEPIVIVSDQNWETIRACEAAGPTCSHVWSCHEAFDAALAQDQRASEEYRQRAETAEQLLRGQVRGWQDAPESFEVFADVKAVRGKNTSDGPALEILLDASINSTVAELMALIGKSGTRVRFTPYAVQQRLPDPSTEQERSDSAASDETQEAEPSTEEPAIEGDTDEAEEVAA